MKQLEGINGKRIYFISNTYYLFGIFRHQNISVELLYDLLFECLQFAIG